MKLFASLLFLSCVYSVALAHGLQTKGVFECNTGKDSRNLTPQIRFIANADVAVLNWRKEAWELKYDRIILDTSGDYSHRYRGHLFVLLVTKTNVTVLDAKDDRKIFFAELSNCRSVEYITY